MIFMATRETHWGSNRRYASRQVYSSKHWQPRVDQQLKAGAHALLHSVGVKPPVVVVRGGGGGGEGQRGGGGGHKNFSLQPDVPGSALYLTATI
jgi:hypothetical protein